MAVREEKVEVRVCDVGACDGRPQKHPSQALVIALIRARALLRAALIGIQDELPVKPDICARCVRSINTRGDRIASRVKSWSEQVDPAAKAAGADGKEGVD